MLRRILDSPWFYFTLAGVLVVVAVLSQFEIHLPSRPLAKPQEISGLRERGDVNVLFILIDTLRADRLGSYGYGRPTSPTLDQLASQGVRFSRVEAQSSWTKASMASLWTGLYPMRTGVTRFRHALPPEAGLPAELLREAGFRTGGIWRNGWVANNFGFAQGFELYVQPMPSQDAARLRRRHPSTHPLQGNDFDATEAALEFMRTHTQERFLLYVHYMDVHQYMYDQEAAKLAFGTAYSDAYDSAIAWVDRNVGRLVVELQELDLFRRTLIVIASDHGEGFYEHGREGHAETLYREVSEVPLILSLPFALEPGIVVEPLVRNVDIWPTLLDLLGLPSLGETDGRSLVPLIEAAAQGDGNQASPPALAYLDTTWGRMRQKAAPLVSIRSGPFRLLYRPAASNGAELYDHASDPREQTNLAAAQPERVAELRRASEPWLAATVPWGTTPEVEIDEMQARQLRALGYIREGDELQRVPR